MKFGSVCSGIEAASVAWHELGWSASWLAEIEPFPSAVLAHHYPNVENLGDMTTITEKLINGDIEAPDVFVGGTPCQSFSVAGLRKGLSDERGNLSLTFVEIANAIDDIRRADGRPESIIVWENVPGVLSSKDNAFGCFLAGLCGERNPIQPTGRKWSNAGCVYGPERAVAWRILDAQFFGVAQRRRRVFVVASARADFDPAAVLFEFKGMRRDTPPSREKGQGTPESAGAGPNIAGALCARTGQSISVQDASQGHLVSAFRQAAFGEYADDETASTMKARDYKGPTDLAIALAGNTIGRQPHNGGNGNGFDESGVCYTLTSADRHGVASFAPAAVGPTMGASGPPYSRTGNERVESEALAITYCGTQNDYMRDVGREVSPTLKSGNNGGSLTPCISRPPMQVRRLTPTECERLQGFPDGYTAIEWRNKPSSDCPDGPRYKALGNSMAVPVMNWIGKRIDSAVKSS